MFAGLTGFFVLSFCCGGICSVPNPRHRVLHVGIVSMTSLFHKAVRFFKSEDGPTAVEYAVMLALIVIVCLTAIGSIGTNAKTTFSRVGSSIAGGSSS